jgi:superfamily II DNA/RNA helicase
LLLLFLPQGFDVPAANVVISYDHLKDAVELCQRTGRARDQDSSIVILDKRPDRPLAMLESVQIMQDTIVEAYVPSSVERNDATAQSRHLHREQSALRSILERHPRCPKHALKAINEYIAKTKAVLMDEYTIRGDGLFQCTMIFQSPLRSITVSEEHTSKKISKQLCALALLTTLENTLFCD